jgi:hypothetical protein
VSSSGNPSMQGAPGYRMEGLGLPAIYNVELDPREEINTTAWSGWVLNYYSEIIGAYLKSLDKYPNPPAISLTDFKDIPPVSAPRDRFPTTCDSRGNPLVVFVVQNS